MASLLLILSTLYYLANTITALPHRNFDHDYEVFGFIGERKVDETKLQNQRNREKRAVASGAPLTCEDGARYINVMEPTCFVEHSTYFPDLGLCLLSHCYVPGMPDGNKGKNYLAHKHQLYQYYSATEIWRTRKCPERPTVLTTKPQPVIVKTELFTKQAQPSLAAILQLSTKQLSTRTPSLTTKSPVN